MRASIGVSDIAGVTDVEAWLVAAPVEAGVGTSGIEEGGVLERTGSRRANPSSSTDRGTSATLSSGGDQAERSGSSTGVDAAIGASGLDEPEPAVDGIRRVSQGTRCSPLFGVVASDAPATPAVGRDASIGGLVRASGLHCWASSVGVELDGMSVFGEVVRDAIEFACVVPAGCSGSG